MTMHIVHKNRNIQNILPQVSLSVHMCQNVSRHSGLLNCSVVVTLRMIIEHNCVRLNQGTKTGSCKVNIGVRIPRSHLCQLSDRITHNDRLAGLMLMGTHVMVHCYSMLSRACMVWHF